MRGDLQRCTLGGAGLAYRVVESPSPEGVPTILLGGAFANVSSFQLVEHALSPIGPVLLVDLPGSGLAGEAPVGVTQAESVDALHGLVDQLSLGRVNIIGICNGGPVAHALAARHPERVGALILGSTVLEPKPAHRSSLLAICDLLDSGDSAGMAEAVLEMLMGLETNSKIHRGDATRNLLRHTLRETCAQDMRRMASALRVSLTTWHDQPDRVSGVRAVAYTGEFDPYTTPLDCFETAATVAGCDLHVVRQADHMVHIERPRELAAFFRRFIQDEPLAELDYLEAATHPFDNQLKRALARRGTYA